MDWDRNRRFDDHRGGESYRPTAPRGYIRRSRSPRNRSPRLVADTWVPSSSRTYGRIRSRSPPAFRRRSSRSPSLYGRDTGLGPYTKACSPPRRFSPRREGRPRSPRHASWRPRSPYSENRARDFSRGRAALNRPRDVSPPNQDFRFTRRERPPSSIPDQYIRTSSPPVRSSLRENLPRVPIAARSRSPLPSRRGRYMEEYVAHRRRSPSPRGASSIHNSAPGSVSNSRRSSPFTDKATTLAFDSRGRSPAVQSIPRRRLSRNSEHSPPPCQDRTASIKYTSNKEEIVDGSPIENQGTNFLARGVNPDVPGPGRSTEFQRKDSSQLSNASIPSHPKAYGGLQSHSPPSGPTHGPKSLTSQHRGSTISLLSAPTRPRGGPSFKESSWSGVMARRGPVATGSNLPPSGPRSSHVPTGPGAEAHRHYTYRQNSVTGTPHPRTPKYTNYLAGLCSIIPGGRQLTSNIDIATEKRLSQLDADKDRLFEQIADSQRFKRLGIRDWDRLDRESSICALKSELAEGHLQRITDGEGVHASSMF